MTAGREALAKVRALLARGEAEQALAALKALVAEAPADLFPRGAWRVHELFGAAFRLLADAEGCAQAAYEAALADRVLRSQREHVSGYLFALHYLPGVTAEQMAAAIFAGAQVYTGTVENAPSQTDGGALLSSSAASPFGGGAEHREAEGAHRLETEKIAQTTADGQKAFVPEAGEAADGEIEQRETKKGVSASLVPSKIRVGFLAPDFLDSAAARFYAALLDLPREAFAVFCYSLSAAEDEFTARVRARTTYRVLGTEDFDAAAEAIRADGLHVLVDLGGHTAGGHTLAVLAAIKEGRGQDLASARGQEQGTTHFLKDASKAAAQTAETAPSLAASSTAPSPTVVEAVGWFDTTGVSGVDYFLTDAVTDGAGAERYFSEKLLRLSSAWCFTPSLAMAVVRTGTVGRKEVAAARPVLLGCFGNFLKITDEVLVVWAEILRRAPRARLILQDTMCVPSRVRALAARAEAAGLPLARVRIRMGTEHYLSELVRLDLMLDTFPYPGGGMTATAIYLGVPVLTLAGTRHSARLGVSLLTAAGLPELVAADRAAYIEKAVQLASNAEALPSLRCGLAEKVRASRLCDRSSYTAEWVAALKKITPLG